MYHARQAQKSYHKQIMWRPLFPSNPEYMERMGLKRQLNFFRIFYVPYQRVIVMSGFDIDKKDESRMVFQCHLTTMKYERLPDMYTGRTSFAAHYDFGQRFIYVIGGNISAKG